MKWVNTTLDTLEPEDLTVSNVAILRYVLGILLWLTITLAVSILVYVAFYHEQTFSGLLEDLSRDLSRLL